MQYKDSGLLSDRPALPRDTFSRADLGDFATYKARVGEDLTCGLTDSTDHPAPSLAFRTMTSKAAQSPCE